MPSPRGTSASLEEQTYLDLERIEEVLTGGQEPVVIRVYGEDLDVLEGESDEILGLLASIDGVKDAHTDISADIPQVEVQVALDKAEKYGIKPGDVRRAAATLVAGEEVGDIFRATVPTTSSSGAPPRRGLT